MGADVTGTGDEDTGLERFTERPQERQNLAPTPTSMPQDGQTGWSLAPQFSQKDDPSGFPQPHDGQFMASLPCRDCCRVKGNLLVDQGPRK